MSSQRSTSEPVVIRLTRPALRQVVPAQPALPADFGREGRRRGRTWLLVLGDLIAVAVAFAAAHAAAVMAGQAPGWPAACAPMALAGCIAMFAMYRLYDYPARSIAPTTLDEMGALFHALLAATVCGLVLGDALQMLGGPDVFGALQAGVFLLAAVATVPLGRAAMRAQVMPRLIRPRRVLIVGSGPDAQALARKLGSHARYGAQIIGCVDDGPVAPGAPPLLGHVAELDALVYEHEIDWVIVAFSRAPFDRTLDGLRAIRRPGVRLSIVPRYQELLASSAAIEDLDGVPIVSLAPQGLSRSAAAAKRVLDVVLSVTALVALAPVLALTALAIKLDSRGPVLFRQSRVGRHGRTFRIIKFRTMFDGAEAGRFALAELNELGDGPLFKIRRDPRVTRVGRVLRRLSLDELPQLVNVLMGDMSLVGPRPFVVHEAQQITGWAQRRVELPPGMTGLWQTSGRNDASFDEMVRLDFAYVTNWSLWWDLKILCRTVPAVLSRRGAY
jgi:exopolysaccharide biosynthesis polyprenyl glycosylphosphotransferase